MSHDVDTMFSTQREWHYGETRHAIADHPLTAEEARQLSGLTWKVRREPVIFQQHEVPGWWMNVRADNNAVLGIVKDPYAIIQNEWLFRALEPVIGDEGAYFEVAGAIKGGKRVWAVAKLPAYFYVADDDRVDMYVTMCNSFDGSLEWVMGLTAIRMVCKNTMQAVLDGWGRDDNSFQPVRIKHLPSFEQRILAAHRSLGLATRNTELLAELFGNLARKPMTPALLTEFVKYLFPSPKEDEGGEAGRIVQAHRSDVMTHFEAMINNPSGAQGSGWTALNAATEYIDHGKSTKGTSRRDWAWFGPGVNLRARAIRWLGKKLLGVEIK